MEKIADSLGGITLYACSRRTVFRRPFAQSLAKIIAVPEPAVEYPAQAVVPPGHHLLGIGAVAYGRYGLAITAISLGHILRAACASLDLEHCDSGIDHLVEEMNRLEILGRHYVLVFDSQFVAGLTVTHGVAASAYLCAAATVGRRIHLMQAQIAFARHGHAQCSVAEHLDTHRTPRRPGDTLLGDGPADGADLVERQFARQHHHVGPAGIEAHGLDIGHIGLRGYMDFHTGLTGIKDRGDVGRDDRRYAGLAGGIYDVATHIEIVVVEYGVDREIGSDSGGIAYAGDAVQIGQCEIYRRAGRMLSPSTPK